MYIHVSNVSIELELWILLYLYNINPFNISLSVLLNNFSQISAKDNVTTGYTNKLDLGKHE